MPRLTPISCRGDSETTCLYFALNNSEQEEAVHALLKLRFGELRTETSLREQGLDAILIDDEGGEDGAEGAGGDGEAGDGES